MKVEETQQARHQRYLDQVRAIITEGLRGVPAKIILFGSWARGTPSRTSDIDVAVLPQGPIAPGLLSRIREQLEESTIPYRVDLVDLSESDEKFRRRVESEGVVWSG